MTRKPTSDEQFGVIEDDDEIEYQGPYTELDEMFGHHGYQIYEVVEEEGE